MKRTRYAILAVLLLISSAMLLRASLPQVATGTWQAGAAMAEARTGAASASLPGGQVLMTGGTTAGGGITNSAKMFDPASNSWSGLAAVMQDARSGHSASAMKDGRVLLAGGENSGGVINSLEIYDPASESFSFAGTLMSARKNHGAAMLPGGRVWLVGGSDGTNALASTEIYDPADGSVSAGPNLPAPRSGLSATTLLDGTVLIAGGSNSNQGADQGDLASTLIYDPTAGTMTPGASLSAARSGHTAILLPNNNEVLIAGGSAAGTDLASAELYVPWTGASQATASMSAARSGAAGSGFKEHDGRAMVAGGSGLASSEYYGFATVKTDADDYAPGTIVFITGSGWQPGETVSLLLHEDVDPPFHADRTLTAVADAFGNIANSDFVPEEHDLGVRFYLTATGATSQAKTTFTDHTPHGTRTFTFSTAGLGVATSITITGSRNIAGTGHASTAYSATFTSPGPSAGVGAAITITSGPNALASTLTFAGFPASVPGVGGTYNLTSVSHTSPISVPTTTGTTSVVGTYTFVPSDSTPPVITPNVVGTLGSNGWYTSNVDVSWTVTDPESTVTSTSGCGPTTISADTIGVTLTCSATSAGGTSTESVTIKRDATAPTGVSGAPNRAPDHNGWYTSAVDVVFTGADATSGIASCTTTNYSGPDSATASANGSCTDNAGNSSASGASSTFKYDATAPSASIAVSAGTAGSNGWYTSDVTVHTSGTDATSGIDTCTADQFQTTETAGQSFTGNCTDNAGNTSTDASLTVKLDKTGPSASLAVTAGTAGANGWYISDVTVSTSGTDSISSPVTCTTDQIISTEGSAVSVNGSCTNDAGLTTNATALSLKIDKTGPTASLAVTAGTAGANGWYTSNVTVSTTGSDSVSDPTTCSVDQFQTTETAGTVFSGSCTNDAGLTTNATDLTVKLDKTGPSASLAVTAGTLGLNGWYVSNVTISTSGTDSISNPTSCTADQPQTTDTTGTSFSGSCINDAGLTTSAAPLSIKRDATAPTINLVTPADLGSYVLNAAVASNYSCSDATSGVASCTGPVANGANFSTNPVGPHPFTVNASDAAGNSATPVTNSYSVLYSTGACLGSPGHQILQPINADGSSVNKQGSTVPAKFRVCDANGNSIGTAGVVSSFRLIGISSGTVTDVDEAVDSTTPDTAFRWSATDQQWIYNISTKQSPFAKNKTYIFLITLNDGSTIQFQFGLK